MAAVAFQLTAARADLPQVLIVIPPRPASTGDDYDDRIAQLRAELRASGFGVVEQVAETALTPEALEAAARASQSFAAVAVTAGDPAAAEVWVTDRVTGKTLVRRISAEEATDHGNRVVALRAVELLRASLLEITEPYPTRGDVVPSEELERIVEPRDEELGETPREQATPRPRVVTPARTSPPLARAHEHPRFGIAGGVSVLGGPGGLGWVLAPAVAVHWYPLVHWAGEAFIAAPGLGTLADGTRSASTHQEIALLKIRYDPGGLEAPWSAYGWAGTGIYHLGAEGDRDPSLEKRSDGRFALLGSAGFGARRALFSGAALVLELGAGSVSPRPVIRFAGERIGATGLPLLSATLAWELRW